MKKVKKRVVRISKKGKHSRKPSKKDMNSKVRKIKAYQKGQRIKKKNRSIVHRIKKIFKR
ncbi:hypothetical protein J4218_01930 [Candidatus Pacearchaeota archaeon]|nr:hypothetical protein [uncultured archaeon]MBS3078856.1 hypothetical protein [Candidatus Pacearchaeota archaeon]